MKLRYTCREATRLLLQSQDRPLRPLQQGALQLHWLACQRCRHFKQQHGLMRKALDRWQAYRSGD